jgi:oxygen-dependent protoporphyrinogen oxidase
MQRVVIVGGGISGLSAAYDLSRAGADCVVLEKRPRLGGVIETRSWENCLMDCGPDSFISQKPEALALIKELGLESEVIGSNDYQRITYILKRGRLVALPEGVMMIVPSRVMPMLRSPLLGWGAKIRMGLELFRRPAKLPDRSVADFVIDHFGRETLDYLAEPLLSGVYGGDPRQLSVTSVLPAFLKMEAQHGSLGRAVMKARHKGQPGSGGSLFRTLKGGLGTLVDALSKRVTARQTEAETIELRGGGFRIRAGGDWMEADCVVAACPAHAAAALLAGVDGQLARRLNEVPYSSSLTLTLIYPESEFDGRRAGFGFLVPKKERQHMAACTFVGTKFAYRAPEGRIVLRCFFGGSADEAVLQESDESLLAIARDELHRILGLTAPPIFHTIARWPRSMAQYTVGHGARVQEIRDRAAAIPGLYLAGNAYEGIGIPDCVRTGRMAARQILSGATLRTIIS